MPNWYVAKELIQDGCKALNAVIFFKERLKVDKLNTQLKNPEKK